MRRLALSPVPVVIAAGAAALLAGSAPAGASEGPVGSPPLPSGVAPVTIPPVPGPVVNGTHRKRLAIRRAKIVPRRLRAGRRASLRLSLSGPGRVRLVITRRSRPHRGRIAVRRVSATGRKLVIRLPRGVHGHRLAAGRYRVAVTVVDADGTRSRTVRRSFVVL